MKNSPYGFSSFWNQKKIEEKNSKLRHNRTEGLTTAVIDPKTGKQAEKSSTMISQFSQGNDDPSPVREQKHVHEGTVLRNWFTSKEGFPLNHSLYFTQTSH